MSNDAIERLRERLATGDTVGLYVLRDDARAILDHITALTAERDAAVVTVNRQANAVRALHANEETEINRLRKERHKWHHAVSSLDSEREANARLTEEVERLTAERAALIAELAEAQEKIDELRDNETWRKIHNG
jgi:predicted  nucleic acid-binding Zn-ribbon protein